MADDRFCSSCGAPLKQGANFCPSCGSNTETLEPEALDAGSPRRGLNPWWLVGLLTAAVLVLAAVVVSGSGSGSADLGRPTVANALTSSDGPSLSQLQSAHDSWPDSMFGGLTGEGESPFAGEVVEITGIEEMDVPASSGFIVVRYRVENPDGGESECGGSWEKDALGDWFPTGSVGWTCKRLASGTVAVPDAPETATVPNPVGMTEEEATELLQEEGFGIAFRRAPSLDVVEGLVISTEPGSGEEVEPGTKVTMVISAGPEQFPIPNVTDIPVEQARDRLTSDGFVVGLETPQDSQDVPEGVVISQSLPAGTEADPGTVIDLVVSAGPRFLTVPDLEGVAATLAEEELKRLGFEDVVVEEEFSDDMLEGFVTRTLPAASQIAQRDQTVTVFVSKGPEQ